MSQCCAGCERPILDRFLMHVLDRSWHSTCVQCDDCSQPLSNKCFSRDAKLYCRDDFYRRFGTKCGGCSLGISPDDLVRKAKNKVFHLHCFTCILCRKQLATGEQLYVVDDNRFLCKEDFINTRYYGSDDDLDIDQRILDKLDETLSEEKAAMCSGKLSPLGGSLPDDDSRSSTPHIGILAYNSETGLRNMQHPHRASLHAPPLLDGSSPCPSSSAKTSPVTSLLPEITTCKGVVTNELDQMGCSATGSMMLGVDPCLDPNADTCGDVEIDLDDSKDADSKDGGAGAKRRGPRTTIKAKQLETLKTAFSATPKPTRHIREQLAQETGLNMRVIQVWFQNRRSKERRMKQLSALGARRHFFRNPRRMRGLGRDDMGQELSLPPEMMGGPQGPFNYFDNEFYQNTYPAGFPGPIPDYYGPTPGSQPVHPVSGLPQGVATFMASPPGGSAVPGNQMGALLPTSGAAGLPQLHGLPSQGHHRIEGHPQMAPIDGLPPTPGQMTPDNIFNLTTGPDGLTMLAGNDSSPSSGCATGESLSSMANRYPPPGITSLTTVPLTSLAPQSSIPPLPTAQTNLPPAINGFPQEMTVGDASW